MLLKSLEDRAVCADGESKKMCGASSKMCGGGWPALYPESMDTVEFSRSKAESAPPGEVLHVQGPERL